MDETFSFTLVLSGFSELTQDIEDAFFEAGCDDATLSIQAGIPHLDFDRQAPSRQAALLSALREVGSVQGVRVIRVKAST